MKAESSSVILLIYGLGAHLPLLPTPPRGDAVTVGYRAGELCPGGDLNPTVGVRSRAHTDPSLRVRFIQDDSWECW